MEVVQPEQELKLDLACGQRPREGFWGVDRHFESENVKRMDLLNFPWPWADSSVSEIHCAHFIEHIRMGETESGQDLLMAFFDEAWRIAKPGATMTVVWPALQSVRAFQDPTHRRFIPVEFLMYLNPEFRRINQLDHYLGKCHWEGSAVPTMSQEESLRSAEVQGKRYRECWNVSQDFVATLRAVK